MMPIKPTKKIENSQSAGFEYPLNRFQELQFQLTTVDRTEIWKTDTYRASVRSRENAAGLAFIQDTTRGPYLETMSGSRLALQGGSRPRYWGAIRLPELPRRDGQILSSGQGAYPGLSCPGGLELRQGRRAFQSRRRGQGARGILRASHFTARGFL